MKADVTRIQQRPLQLTAYETGDQPMDAVDLPPELINRWQKARHALAQAETAVLVHLRNTDQPLPR